MIKQSIFSNVNLERRIGRDKGIKLKHLLIIPGLGSTAIAKSNWEELAIGAAIAGIPLTIGENVCGMDAKTEIVNGKVVHSEELEWRVRLYKDWQQDGYGTIIVQANVEDTKLGVLGYAISELDVGAVELKWGQGAKDIFLKTGAYRPADLARAVKFGSEAEIDLLTLR